MSSDNSQWAKKAAIAAAVGVGAVGLYYIINKNLRSKNVTTNPALDGMSVDKLKQLGNKLFSAKKYNEAIEVFTKAIEISEEGTEILKSQCYQNRAASKERIGSFSSDDLMRDCIEALKLNPAYGKAYWRKARLHEKNKDYYQSLIDSFCAIHLDSTFDKQAGQILPLLLEEIEKDYHQKWNKGHTKGQRKEIRHEKVYVWLYKTVVVDHLRNTVLQFKGTPSSPFETAIDNIRNQKYEGAAELCESESGSHVAEALLLAARFYAYENLLDKSRECIEKFEQFLASADIAEQTLKNLVASKHVLLIELENEKDPIMQAYFAALATDIRNVDFYSMAAFRLVLCGEAHEAMKILSTETVDSNDNIKLLRFTLAILANTDGRMDAASLHQSILQLETFVNGLDYKSPYSQCLLSKVYATFGQDEQSRDLMDAVLVAEPEKSIHYFDRSCMARDGPEAIALLEKCLKLEPQHAEANLMCASLKLNEIGTKLLKRPDFDAITVYLDRAEQSFEGTIDFPVIQGVFRMRAVLDAKRDAALQLGSF